jgi:hypothetical protein
MKKLLGILVVSLLWLSAFLTLYTAYDYLVKGIDSAMNDEKMK